MNALTQQTSRHLYGQAGQNHDVSSVRISDLQTSRICSGLHDGRFASTSLTVCCVLISTPACLQLNCYPSYINIIAYSSGLGFEAPDSWGNVLRGNMWEDSWKHNISLLRGRADTVWFTLQMFAATAGVRRHSSHIIVDRPVNVFYILMFF